MTANLSWERRSELFRRYHFAARDVAHRTAHPEVDADEASHRLTRKLSPGAADHPLVGQVIRQAAKSERYTHASTEKLLELLPYNRSSMAKLRMRSYRPGGYCDDEIARLAPTEFADPLRIDAYEREIDAATYGTAGQIEVVLHDPDAPRAENGSLIVHPVIRNPLHPIFPPESGDADVRRLPPVTGSSGAPELDSDAIVLAFDDKWTIDSDEDFDALGAEVEQGPSDDERFKKRSPVAGVEPEYAWSVIRLVLWLLDQYSSRCAFCSNAEVCVNPGYGGLVVGRGQRVRVFPVCHDCMWAAAKHYELDLLSNQLTFVREDGFLRAHGFPEDFWL